MSKEIIEIVKGIDHQHSVSDKEGEFLYNTAKNCSGKGVIVEIGSWKGRSTIWLGKGSKAGNKVKVYTIDPHTGSPTHKKMYGKVWTFEEFKKNIKRADVEDVIIPIVKTSEEAEKNWDNQPIEFLFIDGNHEYESVKLDFEKWAPYLIKGGIIAFHDTIFPQMEGPKRVADSLYKSKDFVNIELWGSITFAQKVSENLPDRISLKYKSELAYWVNRKKLGFIKTDWRYFYTKYFGLKDLFYKDKRILDIGCGPRGSLEWADMCIERIGLDPLADDYKALGTDKHKMKYVNSVAEQIPFPNEYFDVISSFNSLDHVDNLNQSIKEIIRVLKKGGMFLLLTDVNHEPTINEPISYSWEIVKKFLPELKLISQKHYEKPPEGMYQGILANIPYDNSNKLQRYGVLSAKFIKIKEDVYES